MNQLVRYIIIGFVVALVAFLVWYFSSIVAYILISAVLSLMGKPIVDFISSIRIRNWSPPRFLGATIALITIWILFIVFFRIMIPLVIAQFNELGSIYVQSLVASFAEPINSIQQFIQNYLPASAQGFVLGTLRDTANVTMLEAGYKQNVIPQSATAAVDARFLPGHEADVLSTLERLAGEHVQVEVLHRDIALDAPFDSDIVGAMRASLLAEDPEASILPYCLSGGTDNKALSRLGIRGYGFAPLQLPPDIDFVPMFHGIDERVPVASLEFGARVLRRFLDLA